MTISDAIKARLLDITPVVALVGQRVYELVLPQNERRASVRYHVFGKLIERHMKGPVNQFAQRCRVDSYVPIEGSIDPIAEARELGEAVLGDGLGREATGFAGWSGVIEDSGSPSGPIHILNVEVLDDGEPMFEEDEQKRIRLRQEYRVHWRVVTANGSA
jgi:hypothetical protein